MSFSKKLHVLFISIAMCNLLFSGCTKDSVYDPGNSGNGESNFDFATTRSVSLQADYCMPGQKAVLKAYGENPIVSENGQAVKKAGVKALLTAYTDGDSRFSGVMDLPIATSTVYLYSESYGFPSCIEMQVTGNSIRFNLEEYASRLRTGNTARTSIPVSRTTSAGNYYNIHFIGDWDGDGLPYYLEGENHNGIFYPSYNYELPQGLLNRIEKVLLPGNDNSQYAKPSETVNINVQEDAGLTLVFVQELALWRNAMGYYYYETQNPPKTAEEFEKLPKYLAFPNCSMLNWSGESGVVGSHMPPLCPGNRMKLVYYDEAGNARDKFPKGTTVGWFMLPDAFEVSRDGVGKLNITSPRYGICYSNNEFNKGEEKRCLSIYDEASTKTIIGFEDGGDNDFKDVLFYVESDPEDAIYDPDKPTTDPDDYPPITADPTEGTLAFEDLWPSQGDYDMNDVVVSYSTTFTLDKDNRIIGIKDVFTPLHEGGKLKSAFGYQLNTSAGDIESVTIENGSSTAQQANGLETKQDKPTILLFDDIAQAVKNGPITVTIKLKGNMTLETMTRKLLYNPFICVNVDGFVPAVSRREVHLTNYPPTSLADLSEFGRNDDKTSLGKDGLPDGKSYYMTSDLHPFAIDLAITDYRIPDERVKIDDFYPEFTSWARSGGQTNTDWYLKPAKK